MKSSAYWYNEWELAVAKLKEINDEIDRNKKTMSDLPKVQKDYEKALAEQPQHIANPARPGKEEKGSLSESETHMGIAQELNFITKVQLDQVLEAGAEIGKMIYGLMRSTDSTAIKPATCHLSPATLEEFA